MADMQGEGRAVRTQTRLAGTIADVQGNISPITILDLSATGFRLECSEPLEVGERVELSCGRGEPMAAEIRWTSHGKAGGVFLGQTGQR